MLHLKFIIRQSQGSECRKHLVYWHRSLDSFWHCRGWCAPSPQGGLTTTCTTGSFSPGSMVPSLRADMWAAVLSLHYEYNWGFVCVEEKNYLSKLWQKSPLLCVTLRLGQVIVMCEHCHVQHYKWLTYSSNKSNSQSNLLYLKLLVFFDCCWPEEAH